MQRLGSFCYCFVIICLIFICFYYIYKIDIKKESKDVGKATADLTNFTLGEIYNNTLQVGFTIKTSIIDHIDVAA